VYLRHIVERDRLHERPADDRESVRYEVDDLRRQRPADQHLRAVPEGFDQELHVLRVEREVLHAERRGEVALVPLILRDPHPAGRERPLVAADRLIVEGHALIGEKSEWLLHKFRHVGALVDELQTGIPVERSGIFRQQGLARIAGERSAVFTVGAVARCGPRREHVEVGVEGLRDTCRQKNE
jgi:hypothetical protein